MHARTNEQWARDPGDRFIPGRPNETGEQAFVLAESEARRQIGLKQASGFYRKALETAMFPEGLSRVLNFSAPSVKQETPADCPVPDGVRRVAAEPLTILDLPNFRDDFYLNLLDWSSEDVVTVACGRSVYLFCPSPVSPRNLCPRLSF
jgi:hypothetical protein